MFGQNSDFLFASIRLVNGVVEKTRKKNQISIGEAADAIDIPRMLIDIRHGEYVCVFVLS